MITDKFIISEKELFDIIDKALDTQVLYSFSKKDVREEVRDEIRERIHAYALTCERVKP